MAPPELSFRWPPRHAPGFPPGCPDSGDVLTRIAEETAAGTALCSYAHQRPAGRRRHPVPRRDVFDFFFITGYWGGCFELLCFK
ncbi:hypothetical protein SSCG_04239 [Streptomyces clavuligerus]|nr:hypothetical protein SSCG_04239 [Streptomyces clavuligerus]